MENIFTVDENLFAYFFAAAPSYADGMVKKKRKKRRRRNAPFPVRGSKILSQLTLQQNSMHALYTKLCVHTPQTIDILYNIYIRKHHHVFITFQTMAATICHP